MSMELCVSTPEEQWIVQGIKWNNEELKHAIAAKLEDYKGLQYTEDTIKEAKKDRASLNALRTALERERKKIKTQCMTPYTNFEAQVKEIVQMIDEPISLIDAQIKEVEENRKIEKKGKVLEIYESQIGNLKGLLPFEKVFKPGYLNVSKSLKSISEEMAALFEKVNKDIDTIEELDTAYELQVKDMYIRTLDLSMALHENARLQEVEKKMKERRAKEEQERKEKEKAALEAKAVNNTEASQTVENVQTSTDAKSTHIIQEVEKKYTLDFRVVATAEQLQQLKQFLHTANIAYGPVPEGGKQ